MKALDLREREEALLAAVPRGSLIGGEWSGGGGKAIAVEDPATGETLAEVADASVADGLAALDAASKAQEGWAATPARARADLLRRAYELLDQRRDEFALLITLEMGKPLAESAGEVTYAADFLRFYAEEATRISGRYADHDAGTGRVVTRRHPVGPCILITPWNFPLAMATRKIAPALAAGCTAVLKPAELTPLSGLLFAELLLEAGLPAGVLNVVTASEPGPMIEAMVADGRARKLSFTGSTPVGRRLLELCAPQVMRTSMELGGNAALLVFDDADLTEAVEGTVIAKLRNGGESCVAANRIYVQSGIAEEFVAALAQRLERVQIGRGTDPGVELGPLIDPRSRTKVAGLVADAKGAGAELLTGGIEPEGPGNFYPPTLLDSVPPAARLLAEEIFGPVAPVVRFDDEEEGIAAANATEFGLVAYAFTRDVERALRVGDRLDAGMVGINQGVVSNASAPFGGVKQSGLGREGGPEGLEEYLTTKYLAIAGAPGAPAMGLGDARPSS